MEVWKLKCSAKRHTQINTWIFNPISLCNTNWLLYEHFVIELTQLFQQKKIRKRRIDILPPCWENADIRNGPLIRHWNQRSHQWCRRIEPASGLSPQSVAVPYIKGVAEKTQRIFKSAGVRSYFCPAQKIKQILSRPKDPIPPQDACGVVYHIKCDGSEATDESPCSESYIGEMERSLRSRFLEHRRPSSIHSEVSSHINQDSHPTRFPWPMPRSWTGKMIVLQEGCVRPSTYTLTTQALTKMVGGTNSLISRTH